MQNLHRRFVLCINGQIYGGYFAKFVAFSEYMNFTYQLELEVLLRLAQIYMKLGKYELRTQRHHQILLTKKIDRSN